MKSATLLFGLLVLFALGGCKKPVVEVTDKTIPPLVLSVPIQDSLPEVVVKALQLDHVTGLKIQYHTGLYANYFEYNAEKHQLLRLMSNLPFAANASRADVFCREMPSMELQTIQTSISITEAQAASSFWENATSTTAIFECVKPPYRHIIRVVDDHRIFHRVEFTG